MKLNYHHLFYFWRVAQSGHLTRTAETLHISQSALSGQIRKLEESLGQALFIREGRRLKLSEAGRLAFSYAEDIFRQGQELSELFASGVRPNREVIRIGAVATLSRNFQEGFLRPLLGRDDLEMGLQSGNLDELLRSLATHQLDLVLSNQSVQGNEQTPWRSRLIARQTVSVIGPPGLTLAGDMPDKLMARSLILPGAKSNIRQAFEQICEHYRVQPTVAIEVDDMAMMRLLTRDTGYLAVLPPVVVKDELKAGVLMDYGELPGVYEDFYAISIRRQFVSPILESLLTRIPDDLLAAEFLHDNH